MVSARVSKRVIDYQSHGLAVRIGISKSIEGVSELGYYHQPEIRRRFASWIEDSEMSSQHDGRMGL